MCGVAHIRKAAPLLDFVALIVSSAHRRVATAERYAGFFYFQLFHVTSLSYFMLFGFSYIAYRSNG